ncbi:ferredoxin [Sphaerisporangium rubeum]|uniref:Ferredoxin n=1 Tax=Sphaerisporangium rubeum TaxID=321317 RepID=A0A7X0IHK4_9ACTN|nr:ferredoxin [Sphaerisporangium rubeum]MBB6475379.1 ferredoxin [Sphaerisporangium rubeum]
MRISADQDRCLGAGQCVLSAPERFDQSDEGLVVVLDDDVPDRDADDIRLVLSLCPSQALTLEA